MPSPVAAKRRFYRNELYRISGPRGARLDRAKQANKVVSLRSDSDKALNDRTEWLMDPAHSDIQGIDTKMGKRGRKPRMSRRKFKAYRRRFNRQSKRKRRADLRQTAKVRTRIRYKTPHSFKVRNQWMRDPASADIMGIDNKRAMGKRRRRSMS